VGQQGTGFGFLHFSVFSHDMVCIISRELEVTRVLGYLLPLSLWSFKSPLLFVAGTAFPTFHLQGTSYKLK